MTFTTKLLIDNYINAYDVDGKFWYYDLMFAPGGMDSNNTEIETEASLRDRLPCDLVPERSRHALQL